MKFSERTLLRFVFVVFAYSDAQYENVVIKRRSASFIEYEVHHKLSTVLTDNAAFTPLTAPPFAFALHHDAPCRIQRQTVFDARSNITTETTASAPPAVRCDMHFAHAMRIGIINNEKRRLTIVAVEEVVELVIRFECDLGCSEQIITECVQSRELCWRVRPDRADMNAFVVCVFHVVIADEKSE